MRDAVSEIRLELEASGARAASPRAARQPGIGSGARKGRPALAVRSGGDLCGHERSGQRIATALGSGSQASAGRSRRTRLAGGNRNHDGAARATRVTSMGGKTLGRRAIGFPSADPPTNASSFPSRTRFGAARDTKAAQLNNTGAECTSRFRTHSAPTPDLPHGGAGHTPFSGPNGPAPSLLKSPDRIPVGEWTLCGVIALVTLAFAAMAIGGVVVVPVGK